MTESEYRMQLNYRVRKEYSDRHQMYFYYPEKQESFLWMQFWMPIGGPSCLFAWEKEAVKYIENYKLGKTNTTEYIYL